MRRKEAGILMIFDPVSRKIYEKTRLYAGMLFQMVSRMAGHAALR
jgi:hypothetical protein